MECCICNNCASRGLCRYINYFGCEKFSSGIYYVESKYYNRETGEDVPGAFDGDHFYHTWSDVPAHFRCRHPEASPISAVLYSISFVLICTFGAFSVR